MPKVELNSYDLFIKEITDKEGNDVKVVSLRSALAFNEDFIIDMREQGVKEYEKQENTSSDE